MAARITLTPVVLEPSARPMTVLEHELVNTALAWEQYVERLLTHPQMRAPKAGEETKALLLAAQRVRRERRR